MTDLAYWFLILTICAGANSSKNMRVAMALFALLAMILHLPKP